MTTQKSLHRSAPLAVVLNQSDGYPRICFWKECGCEWTMDQTGLVHNVKVCSVAGPQPQYDEADQPGIG